MNLNSNHLFINKGRLIFDFLNLKQTRIKRKFTIIRSFTLLILVLSRIIIIIIFVKTKPEHGKYRKHDTRGSMAPFSHLLSFAYGLYMTTATLLNGHLCTVGYIIHLIVCIPVQYFIFPIEKRLFLNAVCFY